MFQLNAQRHGCNINYFVIFKILNCKITCKLFDSHLQIEMSTYRYFSEDI